MHTAIEWLYLIEILHQTTTTERPTISTWQLYLIEILHQTTTNLVHHLLPCGCILSKFYIKPQQLRKAHGKLFVVSYRNSTSNHNRGFRRCGTLQLYLIEILHQTTTCGRQRVPQKSLYLIEILHQTTTTAVKNVSSSLLYLIEILHQTTTTWRATWKASGCILSKFYIKPQRRASYWLIKCYLRAVCHYKNTIGCSDEASLMHFPYFKERK